MRARIFSTAIAAVLACQTVAIAEQTVATQISHTPKADPSAINSLAADSQVMPRTSGPILRKSPTFGDHPKCLMESLTIDRKDSSAETRPARCRILGAWRLIRYSATLANGVEVFPHGRNPDGLIIYSPDGWMSVYIKADESKIIDSGKEGREQLAESSSYYGPFSVDEKAMIVTHHVRQSFLKIMLGEQQRHFTFEGDELVLSANTGGMRVVLRWRRVDPN